MKEKKEEEIDRWYLQPEEWFIKEKEKEDMDDKIDSSGYPSNPLKRQKIYIKNGWVSKKGIYKVEMFVRVYPPDTIPYSAYELEDELQNGYLKRIERIYASARPATKKEIKEFEYDEKLDIIRG